MGFVPAHGAALLNILNQRGGLENIELPGLAECYTGQVDLYQSLFTPEGKIPNII